MPDLQTYIREKVESGAKKADIQEQLASVGWSDDEVDEAYAAALKSLGVPVPDEGARGAFGKKASTLEIVLNFFSFILLGIIVTALGSLFFEVIDRYFPDPLSRASSSISTSSVHYAIAALVIAFPLYYFAVRMWLRKFSEDSAKRESRLTKWITYLVLLASSVTIVGDLIAILFTFLQGEMSIRFFLKALVILGIAGMIFKFYFLERKRVQYRHDVPRKTFQIFGWGFSGIVVIGIILGFLAAGSPQTERMRTFDDRRASDLSNLASCIDQYARVYKRLPESLDTLSQSGSSYCANLRDPETGTAYEYKITVPSRTMGTNREGEYELCATFSLASDETMEDVTVPMYQNGTNKWTTHAAGRECDSQTVVLEDLSSVK